MARVLLVEDNEQERRMIASLLYYNGFDVLEADDGISGMEIARDEQPDLIVMDYKLPRLDGLLAAEILRSTPETASIPILCITAYQVSAERVRASGCRELIRKPMPTHELVLTIRRHLESKELPLSLNPSSPT